MIVYTCTYTFTFVSVKHSNLGISRHALRLDFTFKNSLSRPHRGGTLVPGIALNGALSINYVFVPKLTIAYLPLFDTRACMAIHVNFPLVRKSILDVL